MHHSDRQGGREVRQDEAKIIAACEDKRSSGALAATVNCRPADGAVTDPATADKLTTAAGKVQPTIDAKCTGPLPPLGPRMQLGHHERAARRLHHGPGAGRRRRQSQRRHPDRHGLQRQRARHRPGSAGVREGDQQGRRQVSRQPHEARALLRGEPRQGQGERFCPDAKAAAKLETARAKLDKAIRADCTEAQLAARHGAEARLRFPVRGVQARELRPRTRHGRANANVLPVLDRAIRCLTDAHAQVADRMAQIGFPAPEMSAFAQGVAAGDATDTAAVFWTRLPDSTSGAMLDISTDPTFATGVQTIGGHVAGGRRRHGEGRRRQPARLHAVLLSLPPGH